MKFRNWSPVQILAAGFIVIILIGAVLLSFPAASRNGVPIPFFNAIFTSVSATCVTGLVVYDTWTQFSVFGQIVILLLIQIGGLGFMTAVIAIFMLMRRRIGLRQRSILAESVGADQLAGVVRLFRHIMFGTMVCELGGAILLAIRFVPTFGWGRGIWFSVFHAVSAFCNAGFDLMGFLSPGSSLTSFYNDPMVILPVSGLILAGGMGFLVWDDLLQNRKEKAKLSLHTKVVLFANGALLLFGMLGLLVLENNGVLADMSLGEKLLTALFHSVTPRTAGFNTVDTGAMTDGGKAFTILLMFLGAAPGGTGGGVKITTIVVVFASVVASLRGRDETSIGHHRLEAKTIRRAFNAVAIYISIALIGVLVLCSQGVALTDALFECFSAVGTVGMSTGVTAGLSTLSKTVIILLMYAGRIGSFSVFLAVSGKPAAAELKNPIGKIIVG